MAIPSQPLVALTSLSDDELLHRLSAILTASRRVEALLVAHIGEVDSRRLYAREGFASMFVYCTDALHLSEPEAYLRIGVARAARDHPLILTLLAQGRLHLSGVAKIVPHLTLANAESLLERASGRSKRQIEEMVAALVPRPSVRDAHSAAAGTACSLVRRVPQGGRAARRTDRVRARPAGETAYPTEAPRARSLPHPVHRGRLVL